MKIQRHAFGGEDQLICLATKLSIFVSSIGFKVKNALNFKLVFVATNKGERLRTSSFTNVTASAK